MPPAGFFASDCYLTIDWETIRQKIVEGNNKICSFDIFGEKIKAGLTRFIFLTY
jgi:hypothetical protein